MSAVLRRHHAARSATSYRVLAANRVSIIQYQQLAARRYSTKPDQEAVEGDKKAEEVSKAEGGRHAEILKNLPSQLEERRSQYAKKFSIYMDDLQTAVFTAGRRLNDLTGYSDIETLKRAIEKQENHLRECREAVKAAKVAYADAINKRSASQREVNELLQRKHAWATADLERFTELYRSDHANEQEEVAAQERLTKAEKETEEAQDRLSTSILARYHEEQIWSDKIRRASTWGTWGLMGFNVLLFIVVQLGLEPWKRKRLVGGFEEKVREVIQEENMRNALLNMHLEAQHAPEPAVTEEEDISQVLAEKIAEVHAEPEPEIVEVPASVDITTGLLSRLGLVGRGDVSDLKEAVTKLVSEEQVALKKYEITSIAVGSAATGAVVAIVGFLLNR